MTTFGSADWVPQTRYARNGDVHLAYQVFGEGDVTVVGLPAIISNIEVAWESPDWRSFLLDLASLCRFVHYDKRGQGMSDREVGVPTMDDRLDDLAAVMDAVGVERAALAGISEGGSTCAMFAATHPERVSHLLTFGSFSHHGWSNRKAADEFFAWWAAGWGTPETLSVALAAPSKLGDAAFLRWINRYEHQSTTPGGLLAAWRWIRDMDIRPALPLIQCPTFVVHRRGDRMVPIEAGREMASLIPGAKFVDLEGDDHLPPFGGTRARKAVVDQFEELLTGRRRHEVAPDRVLATVVLTDLVDSTAHAARLGDAAWRLLLDRHDDIAAHTVASNGGRLIKSTGDGVLATFDAPGRALRFSHDLIEGLAQAGLPARVGVHTGEIERRGEDVGGIAVHIAARVEALAGPGEVLASRTVKDLVVGSGFDFQSRGAHTLKGVPDTWELFLVSA